MSSYLDHTQKPKKMWDKKIRKAKKRVEQAVHTYNQLIKQWNTLCDVTRHLAQHTPGRTLLEDLENQPAPHGEGGQGQVPLSLAERKYIRAYLRWCRYEEERPLIRQEMRAVIVHAADELKAAHAAVTCASLPWFRQKAVRWLEESVCKLLRCLVAFWIPLVGDVDAELDDDDAEESLEDSSEDDSSMSDREED